MKKKKLIVFFLAILVIVPMVFAAGKQEESAPGKQLGEGFLWDRFSGQTIVASFPKNLAYDHIVKSVGEFTELTGIKVEIDQVDYMRLHDRQVLELTKPRGDYDVVSLVLMWKTEYVNSNMLTHLDPFFENLQLVYPEYDFDDLIPAFVNATGRVGGEGKFYVGEGAGAKLYCLPFGTETSIMAYRKDILDKYNVKVPQTYDELLAAIKYLNQKEPGVYGMTMRGAAGQMATHEFLNHLNPFGGKPFDDDWNPTINSPEAIKALEFMVEAVNNGVPGIPGFDAGANDNAFLQGKSVFYISHDKIGGLVRDLSQSKVADKVGFALHPRQEIISAETGGFAVGIPENSQNKEAAFLFIQWMTTKEMGRRVADAGGMAVRSSIYSDPEMQAKYPDFKVLAEQIKYADPDWRPIIPEWNEFANIVGTSINEAMTGKKTPKQALDGLVEPLRDLMKRGGYY